LSRRVVVEIQPDLHRELRKLAVLNDLKSYVLTNAMLEDYLAQMKHGLKTLLKQLRM
jgi:hypothetical protein